MRNVRRYVMPNPEMMFEMIDEDPSEKTMPMKSEIPLKASVCDPGM
jgi:hypothetical protein